MFHTSKSKLAHAAVIAGTISLLLSSSAFAGFNGARVFRGGSFGVAGPATSGNAGIAALLAPYNGPGAISGVQLGAANNPPPRQIGKPRVNGCYFRPCG